MPTTSLLLESDEQIQSAEGVQPTFKLYSGALKAFERDDGRKMLSCTASSSVEDLHGDTMTAACVSDMAPQAKRKNMVIFLNHSYDVPEDVFGYVTDSRIVARATGDDGASIFDLDLDIVLNEANDRAIATYAAIKEQGVKLGVSIGALITDWKLKDEKAGFWGGLIIEGVNLLEASIVGIPANPRSWVQNAVRALKSVVPHGTEVPLDKSATLTVKPDGTSTVEIHSNKEITGQEVEGPPAAEGEPQLGEVVNSESATAAETAASEQKTTADSADASKEKTEEPTSTVDLDAALEKVKASLDGDADAVSDFLRAAFIAAMDRIAELETQLTLSVIAREAAEANFQEAAGIVEMVANLPLGRKAIAAPVVSSFQDKFHGMYSDSTLALLDSKNT